jgi:hypothetical protein
MRASNDFASRGAGEREGLNWQIAREAIMAKWTTEEHLTFDIAFALKKVTIPGFRKSLTEEHRIAIAKTVLEHLKLCRWEFSKPSEPVQ